MKAVLSVSILCFAAAFMSAQTATPPKPATHHTGVKPKTAKPNEPMPQVAKPTAVIDTTAGRMTCTLFPDSAPNNVANFEGLADGSKDWVNPKNNKPMHHVPLFNGTIFHRVIPNFMIQGGDPLGTGTGGPGVSLNDEIAPDVHFDVPGRMALANSGPNTNGSQFFITEGPTPWLDGHYVILGQCDDKTVELVMQIARRPRDERNDRPFDPVTINSLTIIGSPKIAPAEKPARKKSKATKPASGPMKSSI